MNEDQLVEWLRRQAGGELIGDDAAVLPAGGPLAVTMDTQIEGVHFRPGTDPGVVARRLLAVNLSDLAAMGARPAYAFLSLAAPGDFPRRAFFEALLAACSEHGVVLAGGDLARAPALAPVMTLLGRRQGQRFVGRGGAVPGHSLWIGGPVGESALGCELVGRGARWIDGVVDLGALPLGSRAAESLARRAVGRHLLPEPQLDLGAWLATVDEGAAIDVSDGLGKDLHRLCEASGVGAVVEGSVGAEPEGWAGVRALTEKGDWSSLAFGGGEDYVLCFTLPKGIEPPAELGARQIGEIREERTVKVYRDGRLCELPPLGWDHLED